MKRSTKLQLLFALVVLLALPVAMVISQVRWRRLNSPHGKFDDIAEYLRVGRPATRFARIETKGTYFIAYGTKDDQWLATPSGPPAYVFDSSGDLIDWSPDLGDDYHFRKRWPQALQTNVSIDQLTKDTSQQMDEPLRNPRLSESRIPKRLIHDVQPSSNTPF